MLLPVLLGSAAFLALRHPYRKHVHQRALQNFHNGAGSLAPEHRDRALQVLAQMASSPSGDVSEATGLEVTVEGLASSVVVHLYLTDDRGTARPARVAPWTFQAPSFHVVLAPEPERSTLMIRSYGWPRFHGHMDWNDASMEGDVIYHDTIYLLAADLGSKLRSCLGTDGGAQAA